jgi:hypothetical protein
MKCQSKLESDVTNKNKSKIISWSIICGFASQFLLDKVFPDSMKGEQFFAFKVFFNNLIFFILIPTIMIFNLDNLNEHCCQYMTAKLSSVQMLTHFRKSCSVATKRVCPETAIQKSDLNQTVITPRT